MLASPEARRRFLREAPAAGGLDHPNIIPIYQAGKIGRAYYIASGYCEGPTLEEWLASQPAESVPVRDAARLVDILARTVHHAHDRGVLHRDLKPSNILLQQSPDAEPPDRRPRLLSHYIPRLTDFSLARIVGEGGTWSGRGIPFGSPSYMAPEQAEGKPSAIGPATDVYGLGCILYELLTGRPPFRSESQVETLRQVVTAEPIPPRRLRADVPRNLEAILLKCLEKPPGRRYPTAGELADDLGRFLADRPIRARSALARARFLGLARRHPRTILAAALALIASCALIGGSFWDRHQVALLRELALRHAAESRASARRAARLAYVADIQQAARAVEEGIPATAIRLLERYLPAADGEDQRDFAWYHLDRRCHTERMTLPGHRGAVYHAEFSPDGKMIASAGAGGIVRLWDPASGALIRKILAHPSEVNWVAFSPDGTTLATTSDDGSIRLWDARTGERRRTLKGHDRASTIALFEPGGETLLSCGRDDGKVRCWDLRTGLEIFSLTTHEPPLESMALSPRGDLFATVGRSSTFMTWRRSTREPFRELHHLGAGTVDGVAFSHDGTKLATAGSNGRVFVWEAYAPRYTILSGHSASVVTLAFSRDGRTLFSSGRDTTIRAWEVDTGRTKGVHLGHRERIWGVSLSPDEKTIVSASDDGSVKLWDAVGPVDVSPVAQSPWPTEFGFTREGQLLVVSERGAPGGIITFSTRDPGAGSYREIRRMTVPGDISLTRLSGNSRRLVLPADDRHVDVWDLAAGRRHARLGPFPEKAAPFSIDLTGRWLFLTIARTGYEFWDLDSSKRIASLEGHGYQLLGMMPDGRVVLGKLGSNATFLWTPRTGGREPAAIREGTLGPLRYASEGSLLGWEMGSTITLHDAATLASKDTLIRSNPVS